MGSRRDRRARSFTRLALIAAAAAVAGCGPDAAAPAPSDHQWPAPPPSSVAANVLVVLDGDSLRAEIDGSEVEIRLAGVNAPERAECHADRSRTALQELAGAVVSVATTGTDRYGRRVAAVWADSGFVNGHLVAEGHALAMTDASDWFELLSRAERSARDSDRGMWSPRACGAPADVHLTVDITTPDPPGDDNQALDEELVTVRNEGATEVDLGGFVLRDESSVNRLEFDEGTVLGAGQALVVSSGCSPPKDGVGWCAEGAIWNNGGDSALLLAPSGNIVAHDRYAPPG